MATVTLERLVKRYGPVEAVRTIDLDIAKGEFVALFRTVGLRQINDAQNDRRARGDYVTGTIRIGGEIVNDLLPRAPTSPWCSSPTRFIRRGRARELGLFAQDRQAPSGGNRRARGRGDDILHLRELLDRRPSRLSGGQRQLSSRWDGPSCASRRSSCLTGPSPISTPSLRAGVDRDQAPPRAGPLDLPCLRHARPGQEAMTLADPHCHHAATD